MAAVKTPEERGPLGAWAYDTRDRLDLSVEQVAVALPKPVNPATIRKAEADSKDMSRPLWRQLTDYYRDVARAKNVALDAMPVVQADAATPPSAAELLGVIALQTEAINRLIERLDSMASVAIRDGVRDALREAGLDPDAGASLSSPPDEPQP